MYCGDNLESGKPVDKHKVGTTSLVLREGPQNRMYAGSIDEKMYKSTHLLLKTRIFGVTNFWFTSCANGKVTQ